MRLFAILALVVGLGLAGTAVYFAAERFRAMEARIAEQNARPKIDLVKIAVAKSELRYGDVLAPDKVEFVDWPKHSAPPNGFTSVEQLFGKEGSAPRSVIRLIEPGEPVLASKVTDFGEVAGIAQRLTPGMRAFTINVDVQTGVAGWLTTGDRVDVWWSGADEGQPVTKLILESVPLIAVDQRVDEDRMKATVARTVTVEVTPENVALLNQARNTGRLSLSLRGTRDETVTGPVSVDQTALVGVKETPVEVKEEAVPTVVVRRGVDAQQVPTGTEAPAAAPEEVPAETQ